MRPLSHICGVNRSRRVFTAKGLRSVLEFVPQRQARQYLSRRILAEVPVILRARRWHTVKVVMQGPAVTVSVNGEHILSVSHDRFAGSKHNPNFRTAGPAVLYLDNIKLLGL